MIGSKTVVCLLDSGTSHNFLPLSWCKTNGLEFDMGEWFAVRVADGQEVPTIGKIKCFVDFGPPKTELTFFVLDCDAPCVLGIPFLQTVNPVVDWATRSVYVYTAEGLSPLKVASIENKPQC